MTLSESGSVGMGDGDGNAHWGSRSCSDVDVLSNEHKPGGSFFSCLLALIIDTATRVVEMK